MGKIAFVFPGQGSQYVGMGKDIAENYPSARKIFDLADQKLGYSLSELCFNGPEEKLKLTIHTQPALLTTSIACFQLVKEEGIIPDYVAGHSLGEYSALVAAESIDFTDAVWLVEQRGKYMQEAVPPGEGTMAAILGLDEDKIEELCNLCSDEGVIEPANYNCPGQIVIAGHVSAIKKAVEKAKDLGAKRAILLPVSGPFHSSLLKTAGEKLKNAIDKVEINDPVVPLIANINAQPVKDKETVKEGLIKQVSGSVKWEQSVRKMIELGVDTFVEIGAGKVLTGLIKKVDRKLRTFNIEDSESLVKTIKSLKEGV